ncbi:hypothetical protein EGX44_01765 [Yersinia pseudotuberculosis]|uniref:Uncharacterized protein n=1 Tax=Yersinia pseudotuberculosis TaxID=633 RepID=A0ABN5R730_YERPU|nr:hypothetical protein EGX47_16975 [Yersinia pseudotuberculosis]AYX14009.1 hypothetical protein EGX44_01765 [Yersinia pseudotuberculosis]
MITDKDVVPALASVGFNRYTTFGWVLFHNDWINQSSTHANVECKKPRRLTEASLCLRHRLKTDTAPYLLIIAHLFKSVNNFYATF